jgi:hypothetical protein
MMGIPTNNKKVQEKAKREAMNRISQNANVKIMKSEMAEKKLSPMAGKKSKMAMMPSKMYRRRMA